VQTRRARQVVVIERNVRLRGLVGIVRLGVEAAEGGPEALGGRISAGGERTEQAEVRSSLADMV